jgi:arginine/lysine/ornithine decarboxylase
MYLNPEHKHRPDHNAPMTSKNSTKDKDRHSEGFYILLCIYGTYFQIIEDTRKIYEMHLAHGATVHCYD